MTKPTGNPRGRPKGSKDVAPLLRMVAKKVVEWWMRGSKWQRDLNALNEKDRITMVTKIADLGVQTELPKYAPPADGLNVTFVLNGVREARPIKGEVVDVTPAALPEPVPGPILPDPKLYRPPEPCEAKQENEVARKEREAEEDQRRLEELERKRLLEKLETDLEWVETEFRSGDPLWPESTARRRR